MLSANDKSQNTAASSAGRILPGKDQAKDLKSSSTTQTTLPSLTATTKQAAAVTARPPVRLNMPVGSPTDKMMSPCTRQLQSKKFQSLRPKLLADSFRNAMEKQQLAEKELQQKAIEKSDPLA